MMITSGLSCGYLRDVKLRSHAGQEAMSLSRTPSAPRAATEYMALYRAHDANVAGLARLALAARGRRLTILLNVYIGATHAVLDRLGAVGRFMPDHDFLHNARFLGNDDFLGGVAILHVNLTIRFVRFGCRSVRGAARHCGVLLAQVHVFLDRLFIVMRSHTPAAAMSFALADLNLFLDNGDDSLTAGLPTVGLRSLPAALAPLRAALIDIDGTVLLDDVFGAFGIRVVSDIDTEDTVSAPHG